MLKACPGEQGRGNTMNDQNPQAPSSAKDPDLASGEGLASEDLFGNSDDTLPPIDAAPALWKPQPRETAGLEQPRVEPLAPEPRSIKQAAPPRTPTPSSSRRATDRESNRDAADFVEEITHTGDAVTVEPDASVPVVGGAAAVDAAASAAPADTPPIQVEAPAAEAPSDPVPTPADQPVEPAASPGPPAAAVASAVGAPTPPTPAPPAEPVPAPQTNTPVAGQPTSDERVAAGTPRWLLPAAALIGVLALIGTGALVAVGLGGSGSNAATEIANTAVVADSEPGGTSLGETADPQATGETETEAQSDVAVATVEPDATAEPDPTAEPEPTAEREPAARSAETDAQPAEDPSVPDQPLFEEILIPLDLLPPRGAYYRDGKLYLEGAVPNEEIAQQFVTKAAAVIGPSNVINNYVIHPDAEIPTDGNVYVESAVLFAPGSTAVQDDFVQVLELGVLVMRTNPQVTMVVEGHSDSTGGADVNLRLSADRAWAAVDWMAAQGIDASRFTAVGKGEAEPVADNDTEAGRAANRRLEVELVDLLLE